MKILWTCLVVLFTIVSGCHTSSPLRGSIFTNPLGMQAYTYRNSWDNPIAVLDTIKALGITELEGGSIKSLSDTTFKKLLEERGIQMRSVGTNFESLSDGKKVQEVVDRAKFFGASYIMVAWIPHGKSFELEHAQKAIDVFNKAGKIFKENGLTFCYHIHGYEFKPYDNGTLFDYMATNLQPEYVSFEIDIMWAFFGGQDPAKLILKYGDRWKLMHIKDLKKGVQGNLTGLTAIEHDVAVGTGQLNIPEIMKAAKKVGIKHYFIEDESPHHAVQIPQTIQYLRSMKE